MIDVLGKWESNTVSRGKFISRLDICVEKFTAQRGMTSKIFFVKIYGKFLGFSFHIKWSQRSKKSKQIFLNFPREISQISSNKFSVWTQSRNENRLTGFELNMSRYFFDFLSLCFFLMETVGKNF